MITKKKRAELIERILNQLFPNPTIPLHHKDPYTLLIAVLLSARSTDAMVNRVTPKLFALASSPEQMAHLPVEKIREVIRPCGLSPSKARAIRDLSQILIKKHKGKVPKTFHALEALPRIGHKSASVVMAQAFAKPAFPVDTHIFRCANRWGLSKGKTVQQVEKDLKSSFPKKSWIRIHLQIIYFARKYCPARGHKKENCPICSILV